MDYEEYSKGDSRFSKREVLYTNGGTIYPGNIK